MLSQTVKFKNWVSIKTIKKKLIINALEFNKQKQNHILQRYVVDFYPYFKVNQII